MTVRTILLAVLALSLPAVSAAQKKPARAKNVILFLADAGGIPTLNAASLHGYNAPQKLYLQSWPNVALSDTSAASAWVTDSAAGMTAIVTGRKTHNGVISQGPDAVRGKQDGAPLKTILEYAEERGLSTGVLSNVTITDATPAACYAHVNDRRKFGEIFVDLLTPRFGDGVDFLYGPGRKTIYERAQAIGKDLDALAVEKKRAIHASLDDIPAGARRALTVVDGQVDLERGAKLAIQALSKNSKGFFLMIESDAHTDRVEAGLSRLVAFDKLIREIAGMVNPDETLLLFTADHSFDLRVRSGGPDKPLLQGLDQYQPKPGEPMRLPFVRMENGHTGEEVLVAGKGPGAERIRGFLPNTELFRIMMAAYGWKEK